MTTTAANPKTAAVSNGIKSLIESLRSQRNCTLLETQEGQVEQYCQLISDECDSLLDWYHSDIDSTQCYWRNRDRTVEILAYGAISRMADLSELADSKERWLGAFPFMWTADIPEAESRAVIFLPKVEISRSEHTVQIVCRAERENAASRERLIERLQLLLEQANEYLSMPRIVLRLDRPNEENWNHMVAEAHFAIQRHDLTKVVLARASELTLSGAVADGQLLRALEPIANGSYLVAFRDASQDTFISVSPERLYFRNGRQIESEAVAGTRPRGIDAPDDARLREQLLASDKDREEHQVVRDVLDGALAELTQAHTQEVARSVVALPTLQHISLHMSGTLHEAVSDHDIMAKLHPTPAVGGHPKDQAREFICHYEPFARNGYAGAFGYVSADNAEFAVGIRAASIEGRNATLYAGAGIVAGSDPTVEWQELDHKIRLWLELFEK